MCVVRSNLLVTFDSCIAEMTAARPHRSGLDVAQSNIAEHKERALETAMKVHAVLMEHIGGCAKCAQWPTEVAKGETRRLSFSIA
jgi:hypothetical protein